MFTVLGANGFVGSHVVGLLRSRSEEVQPVGRRELPVLEGHLGHVIDCIGMTADFRTRPLDTMAAHVTVIEPLLRDYAFDSFVFTSSTRVYAGSTAGDETQALRVQADNPDHLYNISKLAGESMVLHCGRANCRVARISNVVGEGGHRGDFINALISEAHGGTIQLRTAATSAKDYIDVEDVAALLIAIAIQGRDPIYNIASGYQLTHRQIVEALGCEVAGGGPEVCFPPIRIERARRDFGYRPRESADLLERIKKLPRAESS